MKKRSLRIIIAMLVLICSSVCTYAYAYDYEEDYEEEAACTEHNFVKVAGVEPTCEKIGWAKYVCNDCGYRKSSDIPATDDHAFGDWTVKSYGCMEEGYKYRYCTVCGAYDEEVVPMPGHKYKLLEVKASSKL